LGRKTNPIVIGIRGARCEAVGNARCSREDVGIAVGYVVLSTGGDSKLALEERVIYSNGVYSGLRSRTRFPRAIIMPSRWDRGLAREEKKVKNVTIIGLSKS
jgi:hypothetical protein